MAPKFPKCLKIARQIGDRRINRVLHEIFFREKRAYMGQERIYNEIIDEILVRVEERHAIIGELKKFVGEHVLDEALDDLKAAEQEDFAEIGRLMQMGHSANVRAGEKCKIIKKVKKS
ncbi:hypothetical protein CTI12_AA306370 [Artemisia annua]|uniref:Uncharacterized protein n=1 Tax=Artemisia annua TaxID=35608 RepID=A0A2U1M3J3_ARTAN|nr:hypothetical protein CTI12_AA278620 [Artemisia annua]PWA68660.1 hypothetical protein CTI12_AA306370 [Artemisia annua]